MRSRVARFEQIRRDQRVEGLGSLPGTVVDSGPGAVGGSVVSAPTGGAGLLGHPQPGDLPWSHAPAWMLGVTGTAALTRRPVTGRALMANATRAVGGTGRVAPWRVGRVDRVRTSCLPRQSGRRAIDPGSEQVPHEKEPGAGAGRGRSGGVLGSPCSTAPNG